VRPMSECTTTVPRHSQMRSSSSPLSVVVTQTQAPRPPGAVNCACLHDDDVPRHRLQQLVYIHIAAPTDPSLRLLPPQTTLPAARAHRQARHTRRRRRRTGQLVGGTVSGRRRPSIRFERDMHALRSIYSPRAACTRIHVPVWLYACMYCVQYLDRTRSGNGVIRR
jgi:hypothetical protein